MSKAILVQSIFVPFDAVKQLLIHMFVNFVHLHWLRMQHFLHLLLQLDGCMQASMSVERVTRL